MKLVPKYVYRIYTYMYIRICITWIYTFISIYINMNVYTYIYYHTHMYTFILIFRYRQFHHIPTSCQYHWVCMHAHILGDTWQKLRWDWTHGSFYMSGHVCPHACIYIHSYTYTSIYLSVHIYNSKDQTPFLYQRKS